MITNYLGRVPFARALAAQDEAVAALARGGPGTIIGFESDPVVTLGLRAAEADLRVGRARLNAMGFDVISVDRGGQATLHNPGQLVIFPVHPVGARGTRAWVERLVRCTRNLAAELRQDLRWDEGAPGLYAADGAKVAALGLRIRRGVSTHGLAINIRNDLSRFELIRACGREGPSVGRLVTDSTLPAIFDAWVDWFRRDDG